MFIGAHVSAAGGVSNAPANSAAIGGEVFQFFSRSPQGGKAPELSDKEVAEFKANMKRHKQKAAYIHAPYFINLASTNNRIYYGSISALRGELERGSRLGVTAMMTHLGSAADVARHNVQGSTLTVKRSNLSRDDHAAKTKAIKLVTAAISKILDGYQGGTQFLIEVSAGAGLVIGSVFEDVATIIEAIEKKLVPERSRGATEKRIGICLDTQHVFASGYDLRTRQAVNETVKKFDATIGADRLICLHVNDSMVEFGSHKDRHEHIGKGKIGLEGFRALLTHPKLRHVDCLVETPDDSKEKDLRKDDIKILKSFRGNRV